MSYVNRSQAGNYKFPSSLGPMKIIPFCQVFLAKTFLKREGFTLELGDNVTLAHVVCENCKLIKKPDMVKTSGQFFYSCPSCKQPAVPMYEFARNTPHSCTLNFPCRPDAIFEPMKRADCHEAENSMLNQKKRDDEIFSSYESLPDSSQHTSHDLLPPLYEDGDADQSNLPSSDEDLYKANHEKLKKSSSLYQLFPDAGNFQMKPRHICIEGNLGSGKSTLVSALRTYYRNDPIIAFVQEPVKQWTQLLANFYEDHAANAHALQVMIAVTFLQDTLSALIEKPKAKVVVSDRSIFSGLSIFVPILQREGIFTPAETVMMRKICDALQRLLPLGETFRVFLNLDPITCLQRVKDRKRTSEIKLTLDYLQDVDYEHMKWCNQLGQNALMLNSSLDSVGEITRIIDKALKGPIESYQGKIYNRNIISTASNRKTDALFPQAVLKQVQSLDFRDFQQNDQPFNPHSTQHSKIFPSTGKFFSPDITMAPARKTQDNVQTQDKEAENMSPWHPKTPRSEPFFSWTANETIHEKQPFPNFGPIKRPRFHASDTKNDKEKIERPTESQSIFSRNTETPPSVGCSWWASSKPKGKLWNFSSQREEN